MLLKVAQLVGAGAGVGAETPGQIDGGPEGRLSHR